MNINLPCTAAFVSRVVCLISNDDLATPCVTESTALRLLWYGIGVGTPHASHGSRVIGAWDVGAWVVGAWVTGIGVGIDASHGSCVVGACVGAWVAGAAVVHV